MNRALKREGAIAVIGYSLIQTEGPLDDTIKFFYSEVVGTYWDKERRYIDEGYKTIPFPFEEVPCPLFTNQYQWTIEQLEGYVRTWSAVSHYQKTNCSDPLDIIKPALHKDWGPEERRSFSFPILLRTGFKYR